MNCVEAFAECLHILMCGTGFGFSVEQEEVDKLPSIPEIKSGRDKPLQVVLEDSREGWADSVKNINEAVYMKVRTFTLIILN